MNRKKLELPKAFTVSRATWLRGVHYSESGLNKGGQMCCLGHLCLAMGVEKRDMVGCSVPFELLETYDVPTVLRGYDYTYNIATATKINDSTAISDEEREAALIKHFASMGITLTFVD